MRARQAAVRRLAEALRVKWIVAEEPIENRLISSLAAAKAGRIVPLGAKPPAVPRREGFIVAPTTLDEIASYLGSLEAALPSPA
ncbi:MAG: hypothetical protein JOZ15_07430 [Acidobacteria bacterium]|nr:hypothetical protein [Acidobacteriota bacterium]